MEHIANSEMLYASVKGERQELMRHPYFPFFGYVLQGRRIPPSCSP
jgi:hypothetical protein